MIKIILEEDDILVADFVSNEDFNLLKEIGITENDSLTSTQKKISRYLCAKHKKGALCLIDENSLTKQDKELLKINHRIKIKGTYITY